MVRSRKYDVAAAFFYSALFVVEGRRRFVWPANRQKQIPHAANSRVRDDNFDGLVGWQPQNQVFSG